MTENKALAREYKILILKDKNYFNFQLFCKQDLILYVDNKGDVGCMKCRTKNPKELKGKLLKNVVDLLHFEESEE